MPSVSDERRSKSLMTLMLLMVLYGQVDCIGLSDDKKCLNPRCRNGRCPRQNMHVWEACLEDDCGVAYRRCGNTMICAMEDLQSCPGEPCTDSEYTCANGQCVFTFKPCPDGSEGCKHSDKRCKNGQCPIRF